MSYALTRYGFELTLVSMGLGLLVIHLIPRTTASYYNTLQMPLLSVLGGLSATQILRWSKQSGNADDGRQTMVRFDVCR